MLSQTTDWTVAIRLVIIVLVLYVTGAVASHALARAALHDGEEPMLANEHGVLIRTACDEVDQVLAARVAVAAAKAKEDQSAPEEGAPSNS